MPELIDRQTVRLLESDADAYTGNWNDDYEKGFCDAIYKVLKLPTIEAEPVRHGQWIIKRNEFYTGYKMYYAECSECKHTESTGIVERLKFCPNCGAKMTGD